MKTFSEFLDESAWSRIAAQAYKSGKAFLKPGLKSGTKAPPPGWKEKYLEPLKKKSSQLAKAIKENAGKLREYEQERKERKTKTPRQKLQDRDLAKLTYMLNLDRPGK